MVAATRSSRARVCEVFGAPSPRKTAGHKTQPGYSTATPAACVSVTKDVDQPRETSCDLVSSSYDHNDKHMHPTVGFESARSNRAQLRPSKAIRKLSSAFKNYVPVNLDVTTITGTDVDPSTTRDAVELSFEIQSETSASARNCGIELSVLPTASPVTNYCQSPETSPTLNFGTYAGRVKANPLKYLATVLRSKLQPQKDACNLLEIATEIHDQAKNKHNTTLRRIYDVVNVFEAAGLLERTNGSCHISKRIHPGPTIIGRSPSTECSTTAPASIHSSDFIDYSKGVEEFSKTKTIQTSPGADHLIEKRGTRGSNIRWIVYPSQDEGLRSSYPKETIHELHKKKNDAVERISEKKEEFEYLKEELRLTMELIKHNQERARRFECFENLMSLRTHPVEEEPGVCFNNLSDSQMSETASNQPFQTEIMDSTNSSCRCGEFELNNIPSVKAEEDLNNWYQSVEEIEMNSPEPSREYSQGCELPPLDLPPVVPTTDRGGAPAEKGLQVPFVILQTNNDTNVEIELGGNDGRELVYIALDNDYRLFDYRELLSALFPRRGD